MNVRRVRIYKERVVNAHEPTTLTRAIVPRLNNSNTVYCPPAIHLFQIIARSQSENAKGSLILSFRIPILYGFCADKISRRVISKPIGTSPAMAASPANKELSLSASPTTKSPMEHGLIGKTLLDGGRGLGIWKHLGNDLGSSLTNRGWEEIGIALDWDLRVWESSGILESA